MAERIRLGELLVDTGLITREQLDEALSRQQDQKRRLGELLVEAGVITEAKVTQVLSQQLSVPWVSLSHIDFSRPLLDLVPTDVAQRYGVVPIYVRRGKNRQQTLYVAMQDPTETDALEEIAAFAGLPVRPMIAPPSDIRGAIRAYYLGLVSEGPPRPPSERPSLPPPSQRPGSLRAALPPPAHVSPPSDSIPPSDLVSEPPSGPTSESKVSQRLLAMEVETIPAPSDEGPVSSAATSSGPKVGPSGTQGEPDAGVGGYGQEGNDVESHVEDKVEAEDDEAPDSAPIASRGSRMPRPKRADRRSKMVTLTLLDGTQITLPASPKKATGAPSLPPTGLTARDLIEALRAQAAGSDASEVLGDGVNWERMFAALLSVLLKKNLIHDWEFVREFER